MFGKKDTETEYNPKRDWITKRLKEVVNQPR